MQLSEVGLRIGIVVPLTQETLSQLEAGYINSFIDVKLMPLTHIEFSVVWDSGIFDEISRVLGIYITVHEVECIDAASLESVLIIFKKRILGTERQVILLNKVYDTLLYAQRIKMPVYFIF